MISSDQKLRITDFDFMGHASGPRILELMINAHYEILSPSGWVICHQDIAYQEPLTRAAAEEHDIRVESEAMKVGRSSLTLRSQLVGVRAGEPRRLYVEATTIWVHTDPQTRLPTPMPPHIRTALLDEPGA